MDDPAFIVISAGSNTKLLILTVYVPELVVWGNDVVVTTGKDVVGMFIVGVAVGWPGTAGWVQPHATARTRVMPSSTR